MQIFNGVYWSITAITWDLSVKSKQVLSLSFQGQAQLQAYPPQYMIMGCCWDFFHIPPPRCCTQSCKDPFFVFLQKTVLTVQREQEKRNVIY